MEKTVTYLGIERVVYKFTDLEILLALREKYKIPASDDYIFEMYEGYEDTVLHLWKGPCAELTVKYPREESNGSNG